MDPTSRHTVWSVIIGGVFFWSSIYGVNQSQVQRYFSLPSLRQAQLCLWMGLPGFIAMISITSWTGLAFYAYFRYCDPLWQGLISSSDQILPLFTMETLGHLPGQFSLLLFVQRRSNHKRLCCAMFSGVWACVYRCAWFGGYRSLQWVTEYHQFRSQLAGG